MLGLACTFWMLQNKLIVLSNLDFLLKCRICVYEDGGSYKTWINGEDK